MPTIFKPHTTLITILALLSSLSASTELSVVLPTTDSNHQVANISVHPVDINSAPSTLSPTGVTQGTQQPHKTTSSRRRSKYIAEDDSSRQQYDAADEDEHDRRMSHHHHAHTPWPNYNWQHAASYDSWPDDHHHDYQRPQGVTSMPELTTIVYPRVTTTVPPLRQATGYSGYRLPKVTKLYPKPRSRQQLDYYHRQMDDEVDEPLSLGLWYPNYGGGSGGSGAGGLFRWPPSIPPLPSAQFSPIAYYAGHNFGSGDDRISSIEHYHAAISHHAPIIYHHHREENGHLHKLNTKQVSLLGLLTLALSKFDLFGILTLLLVLVLKFGLLLLLVFGQFLLFLKTSALLKLLLLPFLLLGGLFLLPFLFLPFLLPTFVSRYLLPLLLLLPPAPGTSGTRERGTAKSRLLEYLKPTQPSDAMRDAMTQLMASETCVERIACQLATTRASTFLYPVVKWYLNQVTKILKHGRIIASAKAYIKSSEASKNEKDLKNIDGRQWCQRRYSCADSNSSNRNGDNRANIWNGTSTVESTKHTKNNSTTN